MLRYIDDYRPSLVRPAAYTVLALILLIDIVIVSSGFLQHHFEAKHIEPGH